MNTKIRNIGSLLALMIVVMGLFYGTRLVKQRTSTNLKAAENIAKVSVYASSVGSAGQFSVFLDPQSQPLVFASTEITFDPTQIQLTNVPVVSSLFQRSVNQSSLPEANNTGHYILTMAINPTAPALTTAVNFATFDFQIISPSSTSTVITVNATSADTLLLAADAQRFVLEITPGTLNLNTVTPAAPTPTPTPTLPSSTPSSNSCVSVCQSNEFASGICRASIQQCTKAQGTYTSAGDQYCTESNSSNCCCLP